MRPDQVGPARRNTRAPSLLRTCATDRALELGLGHRRAALDLQPLRLVVELLLRPIATARGRAAGPSARASARSWPARPAGRTAATPVRAAAAARPLRRRAPCSRRLRGSAPARALGLAPGAFSLAATFVLLVVPVSEQLLRDADGCRNRYAHGRAGDDLLTGRHAFALVPVIHFDLHFLVCSLSSRCSPR